MCFRHVCRDLNLALGAPILVRKHSSFFTSSFVVFGPYLAVPRAKPTTVPANPQPSFLILPATSNMVMRALSIPAKDF